MAKAVKTKTDKRIETIPLLIEKGLITTWQGIFEYIPRTVVANKLKFNSPRIKSIVDDPSSIKLKTLAQISSLLKVKFAVLAELAQKAMPLEKESNK